MSGPGIPTRLWCLLLGHDLSWVHGIAIGGERPACTRCGFSQGTPDMAEASVNS
jgi:hypothetical protein